jgi:hypothetical protein
MKRALVAAALVFAAFVSSARPAAAASITLPSSGGAGYSVQSSSLWDYLLQFDGPFTGRMSFDFRVTNGEIWPVRAWTQPLSAGSCQGSFSAACMTAPGYSQSFHLSGLPFYDPRFTSVTWDLLAVQTLDFSVNLRTSDVILENITLTPTADPVPEPSTLVLIGLGTAALFTGRARVRAAAVRSSRPGARR